MHGQHDQLDGRVVPDLDLGPVRQRHLRQADGAGERVPVGAEHLERRDHGVAHVHGAAVGPVGAVAQVHVDEGRRVALEPAGLESDGAARYGPEGPVGDSFEAAAWRGVRFGKAGYVSWDGNVHGYIHCMPYGKVSLVIRLLPLVPGYVKTVCADTIAAPARATSEEKSMAGAICLANRLDARWVESRARLDVANPAFAVELSCDSHQSQVVGRKQEHSQAETHEHEGTSVRRRAFARVEDMDNKNALGQ